MHIDTRPNFLSIRRLSRDLGLATLAVLTACKLNPLTPTSDVATAQASQPRVESPIPEDIATATAEIFATATMTPTGTATAEVTSTPTPLRLEVPVWARERSLDGVFAGVGGPETLVTAIGLPDDPRIEQLVADGYQFVIDEFGLTGKMVDVAGVKRVEAPALQAIGGFTRPDEFSTGGVEYINGDLKMVFASWYYVGDEKVQFAGVASKPDGLIVGVYLLPEGAPIEVGGHVFGPMDIDILVLVDAATNLISIDGQIVVDANQPVLEAEVEIPTREEATTCVNEAFCLGNKLTMTEEQEQRMYRRNVESFMGIINQEFMADLLGKQNPTLEDLQQFLRKSQNGNRTHFFPSMSPNGIPLRYIYFRYGWYVESTKWSQLFPSSPDGLFLDHSQVVVYDHSQWEGDENGVRTFVQGLSNLKKSTDPQYGGVVVGVGLDEDRTLVHIAGNNARYPSNTIGTAMNLYLSQFGGKEDVFDASQDPLRASAYVESFFQALVLYDPQKNFVLAPLYAGIGHLGVQSIDEVTPEMTYFEAAVRAGN